MKMKTVTAVLLTMGLLAFALACGGDDDDDASPAANTPTSSGGGAAAPSADAGSGGGASGSSGASSVGTAGSVTIGDDTWQVVASRQCQFVDAGGGLLVVTISGHAEGDESLEISIDWDPRDKGLSLTVEGAGGDPSWSADNASFVVQVGGMRISGEGTFMSSAGATEDGSFEVLC